MSVMTYNGGCIVAMCGKNSVAIATDNRFGVQAQTISTNAKKVFKVNPRTFLGLVGLQTDILTVRAHIERRKKLYEIKENREMAPERLAAMISNLLYEHRFGPFFIEPVIAGIDPKSKKPFICNMDLIGCPNKPADFVVAGSCSEQLYGMCETLWREDLEADELFEVISQALMNAFDRDAISGWGATVYVIQEDKITVKQLETRMD